MRKAIDVLQQGGDVGLTLGLTPQQRQYVLRELMTIMAVYDSHG